MTVKPMNKLVTTIGAMAAAAGFAVLLSAGGASPARADQSTTAPSASSPAPASVSTSSPAESSAPPSFGFGGGGFGYGFARSPHDWEDMMSFMMLNAPNRARALTDLSLPPDNGLRRKLLGKWRIYNDLKRRFPEMATLYVKRTQMEDTLYQLAADARRFPNNRSAIYSEIHDKVGELVDLGIQERKLRIDRMQRMIGEEKLKLAHDQDRRDDVINERMNRLLVRMKNTSAEHSELPQADTSTTLADADLMQVTP
jgi:hypothetical protein